MDYTLSEPDHAAGPYIVESKGRHMQTFILLHGLGSNGHKFGSELLRTGKTNTGDTLPEAYPNAKFVFPTAGRRRCQALGRVRLNSWFNFASFEDFSYRRELQLDGLQESAKEILAILEAEIKSVPQENIILGGISQGYTMSISVLLCLDHPLGGFIGMSGGMPYQEDLENVTSDDASGDDENPFASDEDPTKPQEPIVKAMMYWRDLLCLSPAEVLDKRSTSLKTPILLGHGKSDDKIPFAVGQEASQTLSKLGLNVIWREYDEGHWYKIPEQIDDIVSFIQSSVGWNDSE
jgi:predicted esterase